MKRFPLFALLSTLIFAGCQSQSPGSDVIVRREGKPDMVRVAREDPQMNRAILKSRKTVDVFIAALKSPKLGQENFSVKKPFKEGEITEHMWLSDLSFDGRKFKGRVANDPIDVKNVKLGDVATVGKTEISDWNFSDNGKLIGGESIRLLYSRLSAPEKKEFLQQTGISF